MNHRMGQIQKARASCTSASLLHWPQLDTTARRPTIPLPSDNVCCVASVDWGRLSFSIRCPELVSWSARMDHEFKVSVTVPSALGLLQTLTWSLARAPIVWSAILAVPSKVSVQLDVCKPLSWMPSPLLGARKKCFASWDCTSQ